MSVELKMKTLHRKTYIPTEQEHNLISQTIIASKSKAKTNIRNWTILQISSKLGLRLNEILHLKIGDFDFTQKTLTLRPEITKNKQETTIWLPEKVVIIIQQYIDLFKPKDYLFYSRWHPDRPIAKCTFQVAWHKYLKEAQLDMIKYIDKKGRNRRKICFHATGRTFFINKLFQANKTRNLAELARITRHKSIQCLNDYYLQFNEKDLWQECVKF